MMHYFTNKNRMLLVASIVKIFFLFLFLFFLLLLFFLIVSLFLGDMINLNKKAF